MLKIIIRIFVAILLFDNFLWGSEIEKKIPILCYHRFNDKASDSMTIKTSAFAAQLAWLKANNYTVIPLDIAVKYLKGEIKAIPAKPVVIVADDGHKSVFTDMAPLVKQYHTPVTLFIYPSAISHANYAMTWEQLKDLEKTKLFIVQSHTYWHPNFKHEKEKLSPEDYLKFVDKQLGGSKQALEKKTGHEVRYLAWAFGIYDNELMVKAIQSGYSAAFTIERRCAVKNDPIMALPRYMIVNEYDIKIFEKIVKCEMK
jgi:peptidoglycan/xylan/chitin deacetylase (PgdA/CDA1 family)